MSRSQKNTSINRDASALLVGLVTDASLQSSQHINEFKPRLRMANHTLVVSSRDGDFLFYDNWAYLLEGLKAGNIHFLGNEDVHKPQPFLFDANSIYDFTRKAKARIRENMTSHLIGVLNPPAATQEKIHAQICAAFDCLYAYHAYKGSLKILGQRRDESLHMLIFCGDGNTQFVAHVALESITILRASNQYQVDLTLVCHRCSYFPLQETDIQQVLQGLQRLHQNEDGEPQEA